MREASSAPELLACLAFSRHEGSLPFIMGAAWPLLVGWAWMGGCWGRAERKRGPYRQVSVAETTKQNIFIHEFIQPKHASNPWKLTVQNGSQVGGDRATVQRQGPDTTAYHTVTISRG